jgi:hypothetical protein
MAINLAINLRRVDDGRSATSQVVISKSWCQQWESSPHEPALNGFETVSRAGLNSLVAVPKEIVAGVASFRVIAGVLEARIRGTFG